MSISDEVFKNALDVAYKAQGLTKAQRNSLIFLDFNSPVSRDEAIEREEQKAREYQAAKKAAKKVVSEFEEQCAFVHWFKKTYPDVVIMSIRNGGSRTPRERVDQMREGLHPGAADLYIPAWHLWIEFKKAKGGIISKEQMEFSNYVLMECKDYWMLAQGFEDGRKKILMFVENKS